MIDVTINISIVNRRGMLDGTFFCWAKSTFRQMSETMTGPLGHLDISSYADLVSLDISCALIPHGVSHIP